MTLTEANIVEAHLRDLLAGAFFARPAKVSIGLASGGMHSARRGRM